MLFQILSLSSAFYLARIITSVDVFARLLYQTFPLTCILQGFVLSCPFNPRYYFALTFSQSLLSKFFLVPVMHDTSHYCHCIRYTLVDHLLYTIEGKFH